ncbi:MAG TPA: hypothetical protein VGL19_11220 [Polyangiaceae bacterium]|jgi:hypothetical protein
MSRRSKRTDPKSDKPERARPARRPQAHLPEVMFARRPQSVPAAASPSAAAPPSTPPSEKPLDAAGPVKRAARIVPFAAPLDDAEVERRHLLSRLLDSVTPGAVTRAANAYQKAGFSFPEEQPVQLKLLEHSDEAVVSHALEVLTTLLDEQPPIMLPVFEQRLKRLEEGAESPDTRSRAAELRRVLRT